MESKVELAGEHAQKEINHHKDFQKSQEHKNAVTGAARPERHSGTGHGINEGPKKEGGGKGNWGSLKDDIQEAKEEGLIH